MTLRVLVEFVPDFEGDEQRELACAEIHGARIAGMVGDYSLTVREGSNPLADTPSLDGGRRYSRTRPCADGLGACQQGVDVWLAGCHQERQPGEGPIHRGGGAASTLGIGRR